MALSMFADKKNEPNEMELETVLKSSFELWKRIKKASLKADESIVFMWKFYSQKAGWSFVIKQKKRALMYLIPCDGYLKASFVFGNKAVELIQDSSIDQKIIQSLLDAKPYMEGRSISLDVRTSNDLEDIYKLIDIKVMS